MKCCPEFYLWRRSRQALGPLFYANMAPETAASGRSLQQRTASQPASQEDPFRRLVEMVAHFGFVLPKITQYNVRLYRASITPVARSARRLAAKRPTLEYHVALCERAMRPASCEASRGYPRSNQVG